MNIPISVRYGKRTLNTRQRARWIAEMVSDTLAVLDLSELEFISRGAAAELEYYREREDLVIVGTDGIVEEMFAAVARS